MYQVQTYNNELHAVLTHDVPDAIDYDDAIYVIERAYPKETILAVINHNQ